MRYHCGEIFSAFIVAVIRGPANALSSMVTRPESKRAKAYEFLEDDSTQGSAVNGRLTERHVIPKYQNKTDLLGDQFRCKLVKGVFKHTTIESSGTIELVSVMFTPFDEAYAATVANIVTVKTGPKMRGTI